MFHDVRNSADIHGAGEAMARKTMPRVASFTPPRGFNVTEALKPFVDRMNQAIGNAVTAQGYKFFRPVHQA